MLIYHPAFDPYHCAFRGMRILNAVGGLEIEVDGFRMADFYMLFPGLITEIRLPRALLKWRSRFSGLANPYHFSGDQRMVFERMRDFQLMALRALASRDIIDKRKFENGIVIKGEGEYSKQLRDLIEKTNTREEDLVHFLAGLLVEIQLKGNDGLKARSGLMEHRYDVV